MRAILALLANPAVSKLAGNAIGRLFNRKGEDGPVLDKVKASASAGMIVSFVLAALGFFFGPEIVEALQAAGVENVVAALVSTISLVLVFVQTMTAYFQKEKQV